MNIAEYIIKKLEELGINDFFGLPGDYNFNILYAIKNNPNTKWFGCTNGLNAGYAANGYARIKGFGALITSYGGELTALETIAKDYSECVPVVNIVGLPSTKQLEEYHFDNEAYMNTFSHITAAFAFIKKDNAKQEIDRVLSIMVKERKPVYIAIPSDIVKIKVNDKYVDYNWASNKENLNYAAQKIAEKISKAKKPVIIGDVLIKRFDAEIEYKEFVKQSEIPVSNFLEGLNIIDMDYEKYIGGYFGNYRNPIAQKYIENSDCVIAVGTLYNNQNLFGYKKAKKINNEIGIYGTHAYVENKLYDNIKMSDLLEAVTNLIIPAKIEIDRPYTGYKQKTSELTPLTSDYIFSRIQNYIKENDIIITEIGSSMHGVAQMKLPPNVNMQFQTQWGSIGWATPAAFGACVAKPQSRVILITGDGAQQATAMEIGSILRYGLKPIVIVINNNGYAAERLYCRDSKENINDIVQMNYSKFARIFDGDVWSTKAATSEDFDKALKVTQIMNKMCYIEVCTDILDTPHLTQDIIYSVKDNSDPEFEHQQETRQMSDEEIEKIILATPGSDFEYETIVHKSLIDNEDNNEECSNG